MFQSIQPANKATKNTDSNSPRQQNNGFDMSEMMQGHDLVGALNSQPAQMMVEEEEEKPKQKKAIQKTTHERVERTYSTNLKIGISKQPNPERDCYAYALEYADHGRGNRQAKFFLNLNGNAAGGDAGQVATLASIPFNWSQRIRGAQWNNVGGLLQSGKEILGTISNEGTNHWVNITRIEVVEKTTKKGKVKKKLNSVSYWDPIHGHVSNGKTGFNSIVCLY